MKSGPTHTKYGLSWVWMLVVCAVSFVVESTAEAEILVYETFQDANIADGQPATWSLACFRRPCADPVTEVTYEVSDAGLMADFNDYAMWRLDQVAGTPVAPRTEWSIRSRIEVQRLPEDEYTIVGVGTDKYYWAASTFSVDSFELAELGAGQQLDNDFGLDQLAMYGQMNVQVDVHAGHLDAYMWRTDDPARLLHVVWTRDRDIEPGVPVFWGNWGGRTLFRDVLVATEPLGQAGDFQSDSDLDADDLAQLISAIRAGDHDPRFQMTDDRLVDGSDLDAWVHLAKRTYFGDADLNGKFDSDDMIAVFITNEYEDAELGNSAWAEGDWSGDGDFTSEDMILAFQDGGYEKGPRPTSVQVPEPALSWVAWALVSSAALRAAQRRMCLVRIA